ncbi:MAG: hypothetical protein QXG12_07045 [Thermoproteota archaeon]
MDVELTDREREILERAKAYGKPFEWWHVKALPAELTKLVVKGYLRVVGKSYGRKVYEVVRESKAGDRFEL